MKQIVFIEASDTGAGLRACEVARELGIAVTLVTSDPSRYPLRLIELANHIVKADTRNKDAVIESIREARHLPHIDGVTTTADLYVAVAAYVAHYFGLPCLEYEAALNARNKHRTRELLQTWCPQFNPKYVICSSIEDVANSEVQFPAVVKATSLNDGDGVQIVESRDSLESFSATLFNRLQVDPAAGGEAPKVLIEEYVDADEISAEVLCAPGKAPRLIGITDKRLTGRERGVCVEVGHLFPSRLDEYERVESASVDVLRTLRLDCGVMHIEYKISRNRLTVVEVNPRLAGGGIMYLMNLALGIDAAKIVVDIALGNPVKETGQGKGGAAVAAFWSEEDGIYSGILNYDEVVRMPGVVNIIERVKPGSIVGMPRNNSNLLGTVIAAAGVADEAYRLATNAAASIAFSLTERR
jgi:S-sulfo-L-cysteine synthase (3-phospho-L-serine-dependent)